MATTAQHGQQFNINEHFTELMNSVGLDPADTGGTITFVGEDPIMESRIRLGAAYSIPYMGTAAAAAMIWKMRTGRGQDLKIDLRDAIHRLAPRATAPLIPGSLTESCDDASECDRFGPSAWIGAIAAAGKLPKIAERAGTGATAYWNDAGSSPGGLSGPEGLGISRPRSHIGFTVR